MIIIVGCWCLQVFDYYDCLLKFRTLTACASRVFSGAEETTPHEPVSEDDTQEERERKERIPQRKADISRCWSKYCLDLLKTSRDKCVQEVRNGDQGDDDTIAGQGLITVQLLCLFAFTLVSFFPVQKPYIMYFA